MAGRPKDLDISNGPSVNSGNVSKLSKVIEKIFEEYCEPPVPQRVAPQKIVVSNLNR